MKINMVSLDDRGFHNKLTEKTIWSLERAGHTVVGSGQEADLTHYVRVADITKTPPSSSPYSLLLMGASMVFRSHQHREALITLINDPNCRRIIIMSIHPFSLHEALTNVGVGGDKLLITDEPPYETREFYRGISKDAAKIRLQIDMIRPVALYFGTYFFSKGADLVCEVAKHLPSVHFYMVGDTKLGSFDYNITEKYPPTNNLTWVDRYVGEVEARDWFRAADFVLLPYRHFYMHDTSGIFNQAMLAQTPVVIPDFHPFIGMGDVGYVFEREHVGDLLGAVKYAASSYHQIPLADYDSYLDNQKGWEVIGESI